MRLLGERILGFGGLLGVLRGVGSASDAWRRALTDKTFGLVGLNLWRDGFPIDFFVEIGIDLKGSLNWTGVEGADLVHMDIT